MLTAKELHARGLAETNAGRHAAARPLLRRAMGRTVDDTDTLARIHVTLALAESELGSAGAGINLCRQALALEGVSRHVRGLAFSQLGLVQMRAGNGAEALPAFAAAIGLLDDFAEPVSTAYMNRGLLYLQRGDLERSTRDLENALAHARAGQLELLTAKAEHNLGYARMLAGDLATALSMMEEARPAWAQSPEYAAVCDQDRAEVLLAAGMVEEAAQALRVAAKAFGSRRLHQRQGEAEFVLARLLLLEDPTEARRVARRASRRFRERGSEVWALRAEAVGLSARAGAGAWSRTLAARADALVGQLCAHGLKREAAALKLRAAQGLIQLGDLRGAHRALAAGRVTRSAPLPTRLLDREVRAELARRKGRHAVAVHHVRRGLDDLHSWQSSFGSLDLQSSLVGHGRRLALQGLSMALADGRPDVVFEWSERARALASRVSPVRPPAQPEAAANLAELRQLQDEIHGSETRGGAPAALLRQARQLSGRIRQHAWYDAGSGLVTEPVGLPEVQDALSSADGALVCYLVGDGQLHALVAVGDSVQLYRLCSMGDVEGLLAGMQADLEVVAGRLPEAMLAPVQAALKRRLDRLCNILVTPLLGLIADRPLVVVQAASLSGVPWSILAPLVGRPLTIPRSATSWLSSRTGSIRPQTAGFVAGPRVARAAEEVKRSAEAWSHPAVLTGSDAHCAAVSRVASQVDALHVAAHGRHSADNPLFSGLELVDGPWFGYDIDQLESIPSTVVLSACELGRSSVRWGEETIGMTVAWLHAGSRCVIAAPASVNDDAACELLATTHARLAAGSRPSEALAAAAEQLQSPAPAPFLCFGAGW